MAYFYLLVLGWRYEWISTPSCAGSEGVLPVGTDRLLTAPRKGARMLLHLQSRTNRLEAALVFSNVVL